MLSPDFREPVLDAILKHDWYYIIGGSVHSLIDALKLAEKITGILAPRLEAPPALMKAMAATIGVIGSLVALPETYTGEALRVSAGVTYIGSNAKARRDLGCNPRPLDEGMRETLLYEMAKLGIKPR